MNVLNKYFLLLLLALLPAGLYAQNTLLLDKLYETFDSGCVLMECNFGVDSDGVLVKGRCEVEVQGKFYRMQGNGLDIMCDGESVWVMDTSAKEVVVEPLNDDPSSYMSNPALLFRDMDKVFTMTGASASGSGISYKLSARKSCGVRNAVLDIDTDGTLRNAEFTLDNGSIMKVNILSVKILPLKEKSCFIPGEFSSDWIVTDLRC